MQRNDVWRGNQFKVTLKEDENETRSRKKEWMNKWIRVKSKL